MTDPAATPATDAPGPAANGHAAVPHLDAALTRALPSSRATSAPTTTFP